MNIGIFSDTYQPQTNGVVISMTMLRNELKKRGHNVFIFASNDPHLENDEEDVFRFPSIPFAFSPNLRVSVAYPPKLLFKIHSCKLDIIHTQTEFPMGILGKLVSEAARVPMIHTYHTMWEDYVHYMKARIFTPKFAKTYSRVFCNRADIVIAPTEKTKNSLLEYGVSRPIEIVPTGVDFSGFIPELAPAEQRAETRATLGIDEHCPVVVFVGRIAKEKSIDVTIHAFANILKKIPDAHLLIVGGGPSEDELKNLCGELEISKSVTFTGLVPWSEVGKYYRAGDVFMTSSITETQGLTYIEAMAAENIVVAKYDKSVDGVVENDKTGFIFETNEEAADVLFKALTLSDKSKITSSAKEKIRMLSSERFAESVEEIYNIGLENQKTLKDKHD